jgi:hypothetical protein
MTKTLFSLIFPPFVLVGMAITNAIALLADISIDTKELATWAVTSIVGVLCFFMYNLFSEMRKDIRDHKEKHSTVEVKIAVHEEAITSLNEKLEDVKDNIKREANSILDAIEDLKKNK